MVQRCSGSRSVVQRAMVQRLKVGGAASRGEGGEAKAGGAEKWPAGRSHGGILCFFSSGAEARQRERKGQSERERGDRVGSGLGDLTDYGPPV